jgi:hypothetical protein
LCPVQLSEELKAGVAKWEEKLRRDKDVNSQIGR